jgi:hypothetical protein
MREVDMAWNDRSNLTTEYTEDTEVVEGLGLSYKSYRAYSKGCAFTIHYSKFIIQAQRSYQPKITGTGMIRTLPGPLFFFRVTVVMTLFSNSMVVRSFSSVVT